MSVFSIFKKKEVKRALRDKNGRPYYLKKLPFYRRRPKEFMAITSFISLTILFSAPLYHFLFTKEEDLSPMDTWWPHEKNRGVRDVDIIRGRIAAAGPDAGLLDVLRGPYKEGELPIPPPSK